MPKQILQTHFILLRKTLFQETSVIVAGLSADFGRVDFLLKGARTIKRKKFPEAELFREFSISFTESKTESGIANLQTCEPEDFYDSVADSPEHYMAACNFAGFLLKNTRSMLPCPQTYLALKSLLYRLTQKNDIAFSSSLAKFVYLYESGLLPDLDNPATAQKYAQMLNFAMQNSPVSETTEGNSDFRRKFSLWINDLINKT